MGRATARFLTEVRRSHTVYAYVDVSGPGQEVRRLVVVDGEITVDRTAQFRRAARINCIDPLGTFLPEDGVGVLTPFGTEVRPYRGVKYPDGTIEVYPLGVFRLARATFTESSSSASNSGVRIALEMFDRSRTISRDRFLNTYTIPAATNIVDAIKLLLQRTYPDLSYDTISTGLTTTAPQALEVGSDPWEAATVLAKSIGCELYFDVDGHAVIQPPVDVDALPTPDFTYIEGEQTTMVDLQSVFSDDPGFNGVVVIGSSPGDELAPVRAESWDMEPSSPTYRLGPYGQVLEVVTDSNVKTVAAAQAMADSILKGRIGFAAQLSVSSWVNPALEAGNVVEVERAKMAISGVYAVDSFNIPLGKDGVQSLRVRSKRTKG